MTKTARSHTLIPKPKPVIVELSATPEKFLEDDLESSQLHSQGCLYPYLEKKKLLDDPSKPDLSRAIAKTHHHKFITQTYI